MSFRELADSYSLSPEDRDLLALLLEEEGVDFDESAAILPYDRQGDLPLSFAQERLWFVDQLMPGSPAYNMATALRLRGALDLASLAATLRELIRRHESLRTVFAIRQGRPVQVIQETLPLPLWTVDLRALPPPLAAAESLRVARVEGRLPFDLAAGPLLRILLLYLREDDHLVQLTQHHIVSDGWSMGVLVGELGVLYGAYVQGRASPLSEPTIQYGDFARWQREWLDGEALASQIGYWKQQLAGSPTVLDLQTDHPRPAARSLHGATRSRMLAAGLAPELAAISRREGATLFMTLLGFYAELLHRYTGQEDIPIGTTIANRNRRELEPLVGFFVNTLVMRSDLSGAPTLRRLLSRVRDVALGAYANQDVPFEHLLGELGVDRDLSRSPLFQVVFQLQNTPVASELRLPGLELLPVELGNETSKFDLVLNMTEGAGGIRGDWRYSTDLFAAATVARMALHLEALLTGAVAAGLDVPLADLPLLSAGERQQLVREWRPALPAPGTAGRSLHRVFAARVAEAPEAVAVVFQGEQTSYGELDRRAELLASRLLASDLGPGEGVALFLERSTELVVAILATLKAGGAYVPIDPGYPPERVGFTLKDCGTGHVLSQRSLASALAASGWEGETLWIDDRLDTPAGKTVEAAADSLAYVIYTSGSTGRPKGVAVRHGNVLRLFESTRAWFAFGRADTWTLFHSYAFDFSVWELWGALLHGGRLVVVPYWVSRSPEAFWKLLSQESVTVLNQTPSAFRQLIWAEGSSQESVPELALRQVIFGGEALEPGILKPWVERHGDRRPALVNMYGITETTVHVTYRRLDRAEVIGGAGSLLGRAIPDLSLVVADRDGRPVPIGVAGEICVGGAGLAAGYVGRPELTAARFVPDVFGEQAGGRLYRSGDLGRYRADGDLEYLGRIDQQVKVRGFRIELGEIEGALARCPEVRESVVALVGERGEERLVAYVVPEAEAEDALELSALRERLGQTLPEYMLPSALVILESLPLNANGKVDRRRLPAPGAIRLETVGGYVAPEAAVEVFLAGVFGEVLKLDRVGVHDDFFALGGDSIKGAVLINRVQDEVREIVHVVAIFDAPTVAQLASYLEREHPRAFARLWGGGGSRGDEAAAVARVSEEKLALFRSLTAVPDRRWPAAPQTRNRRAIFVLSPPRSGSTLLRVMLGGHPSLFAPPELELLGFGTLAERRAAFSGRGGRDRFWLEGLVRAVMESRGCSVEEAEEILAAREGEGLSTGELYGRLQSWIGERVLVDKTPSYALDPEVLGRAEKLFEDAFYVHLIRHPHGMIRSFEEAKLDQIFFRREHPFGRRELAELIWTASHQNIGDLLSRVPAARQHAVRFEDLVWEPERELRSLCAALDLDYRPEMALPYDSRRARMTDGPHAESRMLGDVKFHQHGGVESGVAERWRQELAEDFLGEPTWEVAAALGYARVDSKPAATAAGEEDAWTRIEPGRWSPGEALPLSFAQERLWFLDQLEPGSSTYNIPAALLLRGELAIESLRRSLGEIVRRHAALRTTFTAVAGRPAQIVALAARLELPLVDLSGLADEGRHRELRRLVADEAVRPFDLARGPLLRAALLRLGRDEHAALFTLHHVVADGWSMGVLVRELGALYRSTASLPELPLQYVDFALWQRRRLQGAALAAELAYWRQALVDLTVLELPTDRPRPPVQTSRGGIWPSWLPAELSSSLLRLGRNEGATPFMVLLAGLLALLSRLAGQEDVAVGSPIANRTRSELEPLIGFFVNTLVLRGDLREEPSFRTLLGRVRGNVLGAFAHQELPFERIVEELQPRRDPSRTPLFQVLFSLQNARSEDLELPGLTLSPLGGEGEAAKFDLTVTLSESPGGLAGAWSFNHDLFDASTVARMSRRYERLLQEIAGPGGEDVSLDDLSLLDEAERAQLLVEWSDTATAFPREATVPELFAGEVRRHPEAVAVVSDPGSLTYGELDRRSDLLARRLAGLGIGIESRVAICLERSLALPVAALAVLKAAGAYVPLDPGYPVERIEFLLDDTGASVVVTESRHLAKLPPDLSRRLPVLCLDDEMTGPAPAVEPLPRPLPESLVYVIHTSGSTGRPKGVAVPHRAVVRLVRETQYARLTAETFLGFAPFAFDASTFEIWAPLLNGGRLVLAPPGALSLAELGGLLARHQVTLAFLTTGLFNQLVEEGVEPLRSLRQLLTGGEAMSVAHARRVLSDAPDIALSNIYGPTENTTFTASLPLSLAVVRGGPVPLGRPIANSTAYLLDRTGRPVPPGVAGELCFGGDGLARGYFHRPELTAERFVPAPRASPEPPGARLYRSGDLARWLPDGSLDFLGRFDAQLKLRGFRIEPGEIEAVLAMHPAVRESTVLALGGNSPGGGDRRLVAFVAARLGAELAAASLREYLRQRLPEHMVPNAFVVVDALPLTANGKVDRHALAALAAEGQLVPGSAEGSSARTPAEELLAGIWCEVLARERVGIEDDFFALGGHSLLATRVASRIRTLFGVELPLRKLFEVPTVAGLAHEIELARAAETGPAAPPITPLAAEVAAGDLPLSFAQQRLWFLDQLEPGTATYNIPMAFSLRGRLEVAELAASLREIVRRHASLRTTFDLVAAQPVQRVAPRLDLPLPIVDLSGLPTGGREIEARHLAELEALQPFDLAQGPLLRAGLVRLAADEHLGLFNLHHIVADGWSMGVLVRELGALYQAALSGQPSPLPELDIQYPDFAVWQRTVLAGERLEAELDYWRRALAGIAPLSLPIDRPRQAIPSGRGATWPIRLSPELSASLLRLGQAEGTTLYMTLLAAVAALLGRYASQEDVTVGSPIANRNRGEIEGLIGFFVNTLVLRTDLTGAPSFGELLARVRKTTLDAFTHQDLPFEKLVEELQPERDLGRSPLFQVFFAVESAEGSGLDLPGLTLTPVAVEGSGPAKFELTITFQETPLGIAGSWGYSRDLFTAAAMVRMAGHFERLLAGLAAEPRRPIGEIPLLAPAERAQVLVEWTDRGREPAEGSLLHRLFESQADRTPDAVAVVSGASTLTYRGIDHLATALASRLRGLGVGPDVPVAVYLERSAELAIALLAIWKAGGAYTPLDTSYPRERTALLLQDCAAPVVLTLGAARRELPDDVGLVLALDAEAAAGTFDGGAELTPFVASAASIAYVIYTSGSTGRPKGVAVPHGRAAEHLRWVAGFWDLHGQDRVLQLASPGFDMSMEEIVPALISGATLVTSGADLWDPAALLDRVATEELTVVNLSAAAWNQWVGECERRCGVGEAPAMPALRLVLVGAEAMPVDGVRGWWRTPLARARLFNTYGPTEAIVTATWQEVGPDTLPAGAVSVPLGRTPAGRGAYVVDRAGDLVPLGVAGELCLGGLLARGYLAAPELTAAKFLPDPFGTVAGERLYRTGDLVRQRADGTLEFLGRVDRQVKVRGFRIELGDVEATLAGHPAVAEVAVRALEEEPGQLRLAAYVVPVAGLSSSRDELVKWVIERLPRHMVPSSFTFLEAMPLTPNGKVDRRALPVPERGAGGGVQHVDPRTPIEEVVAGLWSEILRLDRASVEDNFFALGGHSLMATQLVSRVSSVLQVRVPLRSFFEAPTIAGLAAAVLAVETNPGRSEKIAQVLLLIKARAAEKKRGTPAGVEESA